MKLPPDLDALIGRHRLLDKAIQANRKLFLSDWSCDNPFLEQLLGPELFHLAMARPSPDSYIYFDEEESLLGSIRDFHGRAEALHLSKDNIVAGPGSSSFLAAFAIWLRRSGYTEVYYVPPLYHSLYFLLAALDINLTPVSTLHAFESDFVMNLPQQHTVLLMCDPVWYAGRCVPLADVSTIAAWQRSTRSLVFVDGSFQYMKWSGVKQEATAALDPELTFRLVCPTKALAVPAFRFAYLLHPQVAHDDLVFLYESTAGGASASDLAFAHRAAEVLFDESGRQRLLTDHLEQTYQALVNRELIRTTIIPECGYFAFAAPLSKRDQLLTMDESYFELTGYPGYCRINLMTARRIFLESRDMRLTSH